MTINFTTAKPSRFSIHSAIVTHKGNEYMFWAEIDLTADEFIVDFELEEPQGDFDFEAFEQEVEKHLRKYAAEFAA